MTNTEAWNALADEKDQEIARLRGIVTRASEQAIKTGLYGGVWSECHAIATAENYVKSIGRDRP